MNKRAQMLTKILRLKLLSTKHYHVSLPSSLPENTQLALLKALPRRDLQRLAKLHKIKANSKSTTIIEELIVVLPTTFEPTPSTTTATTSTTTTQWVPNETFSSPSSSKFLSPDSTNNTNFASDWLSPDDVEPSNRRIRKNTGRDASVPLSDSLNDMQYNNTLNQDGASNADTDTDTDQDFETEIEVERHELFASKGGLETTISLSNTPMEIVEGVPMSVDQIIRILVENNARDIQKYDRIRMDAEYYLIATGLSLRHVRSLKDALVFAAKKTKVPGLSSSSIATGGRKSALTDWEVIDLRETMVHIMTEDGREFLNLEELWLHGLSDSDMEEMKRN